MMLCWDVCMSCRQMGYKCFFFQAEDGIRDLVRSRGLGDVYKRQPANLADKAQEWRENMLEAAAEANEELMNKYLEEGTLSEADVKAGLRQRTIASEIVPMLCGSAFKNKGCLLYTSPSPRDRTRSRMPSSA